TEQLEAWSVIWNDAYKCEVLRFDRQRAVVCNEVVMSQRRSGRNYLCAADDQAGVGFLFDMHVDVAYFGQFLVAIYRRIDDGVVDESHLLLNFLVPTSRVLVKGSVEVRIRAQGGEKGRLVVRASPHPAISHARPLGDRIARLDKLFCTVWSLVKLVSIAA